MPNIMICGKPFSYNMGNLKTYFCTLMGIMDSQINRKIYANYHLKMNYTHMYELSDLIQSMERSNNATFLLDELSSWIDCYDRPSLKNGGIDFKNLLKQVRKDKQKLFITAQSWSDVPMFVRKLVNKVYIVGKYHILANGELIECENDDCKTDNYLGVFEAVITDGGLMQKTAMKIYPVIPEIFDIYDTNEKVLRNCCNHTRNIFDTPIENKKRTDEELRSLKIWS